MNFIKSYLKPREKDGSVPDNAPSGAVSTTVLPSGMSTPTSSSNRSSYYPNGDFRNAPKKEILDVKIDVMVNWLHQRQMQKMWYNGGLEQGVILKKSRDEFVCCPNELSEVPGGFRDAVKSLNVRVSAARI